MARWLLSAVAACTMGYAAMTATAQTVTRPFSALRPPGGAAAAAHALIVELSPREALSGVHLHIEPTAAPQANAQYVVWVNGTEVAIADAQNAAQTLAIAPQAFSPGVNSIQLARASRSTAQSGDIARADAPPVDDARSSVSLDFAGMRANPAPTLAQLPVAFDRRAWMPRTVTVELGERVPSPQQLRAAALAVQGIAARMRQVDVKAVYRGRDAAFAWTEDHGQWANVQDAARDGDVLFAGTRDALAHRLPASVARAIDGPFLGIYPANDGKSVVMVVSGLTDADCLRAAQAFADPSVVFPARGAMTLDDAMAVRAPPTHLNVSMADDPVLVRAALNFAAIHARATGAPADFTFTYSLDTTNFDFLFGQERTVPTRLRRELPAYAPLQPEQAVSVTLLGGARRPIALLGSDDASVGRAVDMLREPATWSLFTHGPTLFDTAKGAVVPLAVAKRSPVAMLRALLANPAVFWPVLVALLALFGISAHIALRAQVARRLGDGARSFRCETALKQKT